MNELENWEEVTDCMFCYENYEILIRHWNHDTDILSAKADLYFLCDIYSDTESGIKCVRNRDKIYHGTVAGCLVAAVEHERRFE